MRRDRWVPSLVVAALMGSLGMSLTACGDDDSDTSGSGSHASAQSLVDAEQGAVAAARKAAAAMTTYDYRTVKKDFSWVDRDGTEAFQKYFSKSRTSTIPYIRKYKVVATGKAIDAAGTASDADHVHVLLFVDQRIQVAGEKGTKIDQPRVTMEMVRQGDAWLVDQVAIPELVGSGD